MACISGLLAGDSSHLQEAWRCVKVLITVAQRGEARAEKPFARTMAEYQPWICSTV
jgi:hypothetical protein